MGTDMDYGELVGCLGGICRDAEYVILWSDVLNTSQT
jgi:hypothetical protein